MNITLGFQNSIPEPPMETTRIYLLSWVTAPQSNYLVT